MAKYKIKINTTLCFVDKECEVVNTVNKMFGEPGVHKQCDYPFVVTATFDDSNMTEKQIESYLLSVADSTMKKIDEQKNDKVWFKNIKLDSIDKEII